MARKTNLTPLDIKPGEHWGCRYRVEKMLDENGVPVKNLQIGDTAAGPGYVEGTAFIKKRDVDKELLEIVDIETSEVYVVPFANVWDIDTVVVKDDNQ